TNAMHVTLPEKASLVTIDVAWTKQKHILPAAKKLLAPDGHIVTLIKPHYEAAQVRNGVLPAEDVPKVIELVKDDIGTAGLKIVGIIQSPLKGAKGNVEMLAHLLSESTGGC